MLGSSVQEQLVVDAQFTQSFADTLLVSKYSNDLATIYHTISALQILAENDFSVPVVFSATVVKDNVLRVQATNVMGKSVPSLNSVALKALKLAGGKDAPRDASLQRVDATTFQLENAFTEPGVYSAEVVGTLAQHGSGKQ